MRGKWLDLFLAGGGLFAMQAGIGSSSQFALIEEFASDGRLAGHHGIDAARAHLEEMAGNFKAATDHYRIAASRTTSVPERDYLLAQAARLSDAQAPSSPEP